MKITDRMNQINGVEKAYWLINRLTIYYNENVPLYDIQVKVSKAISDVGLTRAVESINFISAPTGTFTI